MPSISLAMQSTTQSILCREVGCYMRQKLTMFRLARRNSTSFERTSYADDGLRPI
jgi:hypothetical protein